MRLSRRQPPSSPAAGRHVGICYRAQANRKICRPISIQGERLSLPQLAQSAAIRDPWLDAPLAVMCNEAGRVSSGMGLTADGGTSPTGNSWTMADGYRGLPQSGCGLEIKV